ncbi:MAG: hypothetical protein COS82_09035, partial [Zetaproteobacteria bacterium CG06_land_8_20_14_3_00_59_53]
DTCRLCKAISCKIGYSEVRTLNGTATQDGVTSFPLHKSQRLRFAAWFDNKHKTLYFSKTAFAIHNRNHFGYVASSGTGKALPTQGADWHDVTCKR